VRRVLLLSVLGLLAACAPAVNLVQPAEQSRLTRDGLTLMVSNLGPGALTGNPAVPGDGPLLRVEGVGIVPTGPALAWCKPSSSIVAVGVAWRCMLPLLPPGAPPLGVPFEASLPPGAAPAITDAALFGYRGDRAVIRWLE
jgi:hypothetical protein